jgi:RNA polymerase sigma-32 factor
MNQPTSLLRRNQIRPLSAKEELEMARAYRTTGDHRLAQRLVESHLGLVVKISAQCCARKSLLPDAIQEGTLGLIRAVERFDPARGVRLSTYAGWWIRAWVFQYVMANTRMMRVATSAVQRRLFFNLKRATWRLGQDGQEPQPKEIAARLGVSEGAVVEMQARLGGREVQFETTAAADLGSPHHRLDGTLAPQRPDDLVERRELRAAVARKRDEMLPTLTARERTILDERFTADEPLTLRELGTRFGVSRERARQLELQLKGRLQPAFRAIWGASVDYPRSAAAI